MSAAPGHPPAERVRVLLVDDQRLLREGLRTLLELYPDLQVVGEAGDGLEAEALVEKLRPRVVLMDLRMPRRDGVTATRRITSPSRPMSCAADGAYKTGAPTSHATAVISSGAPASHCVRKGAGAT